MPWCTQLNLTITEIYKLSIKYVDNQRMKGCLNVGNGSWMLEVKGVKGLDVKKFSDRTKCNFSFPNMLSFPDPK